MVATASRWTRLHIGSFIVDGLASWSIRLHGGDAPLTAAPLTAAASFPPGMVLKLAAALLDDWVSCRLRHACGSTPAVGGETALEDSQRCWGFRWLASQLRLLCVASPWRRQAA